MRLEGGKGYIIGGIQSLYLYNGSSPLRDSRAPQRRRWRARWPPCWPPCWPARCFARWLARCRYSSDSVYFCGYSGFSSLHTALNVLAENKKGIITTLNQSRTSPVTYIILDLITFTCNAARSLSLTQCPLVSGFHRFLALPFCLTSPPPSVSAAGSQLYVEDDRPPCEHKQTILSY